jgi:pimeloyl-ACP methyl ester carboxylesterase
VGTADDARAVDRKRVGPPSLALLIAEPGRAAAELLLGLAAAPVLSRAPRGDGHTVLVLPGLMGSDTSTGFLRRYLRQLGYRAHGWRLGRNVGPTPEAVSGIRRRLEDLRASSGRRVSLIGWSLGGIYARELARDVPDAVRLVITLGSPFDLAHTSESRAHGVYQRHAHLHVAARRPPLAEAARPPLPVPATSLFSYTDGIVSWRACLDVADDRHENIAVPCSHLGFGQHPAALWVIADRLAQREGGWRPFEPPAMLRPVLSIRRPAPATA